MAKKLGFENPSLEDLVSLVTHIKGTISPEFRAFAEDEEPGIQLTIGVTPKEDPEDSTWNYQTGDNSFSGGAYLHPIWAVVGVYQDSSPEELAKQIHQELEDQIYP